MEKDRWKGIFCPENKKMRSNIFLALLFGILLLAAGKSFSEPEEKMLPKIVEKEAFEEGREIGRAHV